MEAAGGGGGAGGAKLSAAAAGGGLVGLVCYQLYGDPRADSARAAGTWLPPRRARLPSQRTRPAAGGYFPSRSPLCWR